MALEGDFASLRKQMNNRKTSDNAESHATQRIIGVERRMQAWEMKAHLGLSIHEIALRMGLVDSTVRGYLDEVMRDAKLHLYEDIERWKLEQHWRYDHIYAESMEAWEQSKNKKERQTSKVQPRKGPDGKAVKGQLPDEVKLMEEKQTGDPRYLTSAVAALTAQAKLWGLNAPEQSEVNSRSLVAVTTVSTDEMAAIRAAEEAFKEKRYGRQPPTDDGDGPLQVTGPVVSEVRADQPPDQGEDSL